MKLKNISFRTKTITAFAAILIIMLIGLVFSIVNVDRLSALMKSSTDMNMLAKEVFAVREIEKELFRSNNVKLLEVLNQTIASIQSWIENHQREIEDDRINQKIDEIKQLIQEYQGEFHQISQQMDTIKRMRFDMEQASQALFSIIDSEIRVPISESLNMALITGEDPNPAFEEILKVIDPLALNLKEAWAYEMIFYLEQETQAVEQFQLKAKSWETAAKDLEFLVSTAGDEDISAAFQKMQTHFAVYNPTTLLQISKLYEENSNLSNSLEVRGKEITATIQGLQQAAQERMIAAKSRIIRLAILLLVCGLIIGIVVATYMIRSVTKPIHDVVDFTRSMAEGNLSEEFQIDQKDEIGTLGGALNNQHARRAQRRMRM